MLEEIYTIEKASETSFKEKGSLFIGQVYHAGTEAEAQSILSVVRKKYFDATHNCWAYVIEPDIFRYSDDGEPGGTAGIRIYNAIGHYNLTNVLVVSTRYFGGVKLGVGPLGKAYCRSANETLEASEIFKKIIYTTVIIDFDFDLSSIIYHALTMRKITIADTLYDQKVTIKCFVKKSEISAISDEIFNATSGRVCPVPTGETIAITQ
jgi:uncharacterized YigZ family protein